jgi:hypothetical protein
MMHRALNESLIHTGAAPSSQLIKSVRSIVLPARRYCAAMRRRDFIKLVAVCAAARPLAAYAQQAVKIATREILLVVDEVIE